MFATLGLDVGGANLKAAHIDGTTCSFPFELWRQPERLPAALLDLLRQMPAFDLLAVTMTGELCDCYARRREGVLAIIDAIEAVAAPKPILLWRADGTFADLTAVRRQPLSAAAANWLALATWAGRLVPDRPAVLLDVGSTTTDIIPLESGRAVPVGRTDTERLRSGELVYTGVRRTPVCALLGPTVCAELFATMLDVYLLLGEIPESSDTHTADGRPANRAEAVNRLAHLLGGDAETLPLEEVQSLARQAALYQRSAIALALRKVARRMASPPRTFICAGSGEFLARQVVRLEMGSRVEIISLAEQLGQARSTAACAHALAVLAQEHGHAG